MRFGSEGSIMKALMIAVAFGAALLLSASADAAPSAVAKACAKDVKSVCGAVKPGGGKLKACMKEHFSDLSTDCQIAIVKAAAVGRACKADAKKLCAEVKPGKGSVAACLQSHAADVSDGCKEAMAKAEAGAK
jgi:Cysteine rich repeat